MNHMLHFPPPPHLHHLHGAPGAPMPPPIASMPSHMMASSATARQMYHHQYQTTLARRQLRQQQVSNGDVAHVPETTPICRCRVIYLGSSVPHVTKDGLQGIQEPLRDLYPEQGLLATATTESIGIDSWLSVWSNGILIENVDDSGREMKKFFPIDSLHYCAAVRYVVIPGAKIDSSTSSFSNTMSGATVKSTSCPTSGHNDSLHNKSSFNGDAVSSSVTSDASQLIASTGTSQHAQHQQLNFSPSAAASACTSSSHGQSGQSAPVATDAKIKFLPLDSPFSRNSNTCIHPPLFACILRRTTGIKVLECHAFICKRDQAANALVRCCFHAYADSMHAKQMEAEMDNEQESTYGAISVSDGRVRRGHESNGHSNSPDGPSGDSLGDGSPNYRASPSSSSNAQVNGKSRPATRDNRHHKRSINGAGSTMSTGQGSLHFSETTANRFSRSISDLDSVENKIEAWRQRSTEALNMEAQQQHKSSAVEAQVHTESPSSRLSRSRRALSSGAIAAQSTTLAEYRRRRSHDQYSDEEVEAIVDEEDDDDQVNNDDAHAPKRVNGNNEANRNHLEGVYDNLDDEEDDVDEDEDGNYKVWHSRGRRGTDSGVGGVRSLDSTIVDAVPTNRSTRYQQASSGAFTGGASLMYPAAVSTPHLPSLPASHPVYHAGHFIHFNGHRGTIARSGHLAHMPSGHLTLAPLPFHPPSHPAYLMDGRATLRSVRTTASSRAPTHFASGTLNRPASVATSRSMTNLAATGSLISPPPFLPPHASPFFPVPSTLSKKELKNLKNTIKKLKKKSKQSKGDHFVPFPGPPGHPMMRPLAPSHPMALPFPHGHGHPHPPHGPFAVPMHPSGRPMPMFMLPHSPPPPPGHLMLQDEPMYVPTMRPMTPISLIPDGSVYNGPLRNAKKDNKHIVNGTLKNNGTVSGGGKVSSKESSSSRRNSSSPGESMSASGSKNNLLHQNYPSVHHSSNGRTCQIDSSSEQEVHSDSSGFNTGGIYRKKANLNERAFSYSIRQESRSRSNSMANVNFPPHSLASGDEESPPLNGDSYSSTASSSLHNAMQRHSMMERNGVSRMNGANKSHLSSLSDDRQQQMNYYNKQNGDKYCNGQMYSEEITEEMDNLTLNGGYKGNENSSNGGGGGQSEMYYQQTQMMHSAGKNGYHDSSKVRHQQQQMNGGGGGGNRCDSSLSSSTLQGNVKTASIKRGSGLSLHQLHASMASNGAVASTTSGSKIALTPVPPIPPHLLGTMNGNHSTNANSSAGQVNGGCKVTSRSSSRENL